MSTPMPLQLSAPNLRLLHLLLCHQQLAYRLIKTAAIPLHLSHLMNYQQAAPYLPLSQRMYQQHLVKFPHMPQQVIA
jgi:hypothetical protein